MIILLIPNNNVSVLLLACCSQIKHDCYQNWSNWIRICWQVDIFTI